MANLKELRTRIASVKTTKQMTGAMKMVAAAKLRKAQQAITLLKPYAEKIHEISQNLLKSSYEDTDNTLFNTRKIKNVLLIIITSNKGLCGAFNSNVEKKTLELIEKYKNKGINTDNINLYCFGKKGSESMNRKKANIIKNDFKIYDNLTYNYAINITSDLINQYNSKKYDKIQIIYNSFKNTATQILTVEQFLPIQIPENNNNNNNYVYEPNRNYVLNKIIPETLTMQIYKAILDSYAAEHGARMTAMHKATDNASELINDLTLSYNKARQAAITTEILEIVGGANALKS